MKTLKEGYRSHVPVVVTTKPFWLYNQTQECRGYKENREGDRKLKKEKLSSSAFVKCSAVIVSSERATKARTSLLEQNRSDKKDGEDYLHIRQYSTDDFHVTDNLSRNSPDEQWGWGLCASPCILVYKTRLLPSRLTTRTKCVIFDSKFYSYV